MGRLSVQTPTSSPFVCKVSTLEAPPAVQGDPTEKYATAILLHGFGWDSNEKGGWYKTIAEKVNDIKALGITHVWLPPPSQSVAPQGYLPGQLYNLESKYGNKEELKALIKELKGAGIKSLADIVINHRCAQEQDDGVWNKFRDDVEHDGPKVDWGKWAITGNDTEFAGTGNPDTGDDYGAAPDLDHANPDLRAALTQWLHWLQTEIGYDGWRFDYVKGYAPIFTKEYVEATTTGSELNVGELWPDLKWNGPDLDRNQDEGRKKITDWIEGAENSCTAFDFVTKGIVQEAIKNTQYSRLKDAEGKAPGVIGWSPALSVTFIDNHDTGSTQGHWPFPDANVPEGYAYLLTHPGVPSIFWDHVFTFGEDVKKAVADLVALRNRNGIKASSKLEIQVAEDDLYLAKIDDKVLLKLGPRENLDGLLPKEGWKVGLSGKNFTVWEKASA